MSSVDLQDVDLRSDHCTSGACAAASSAALGEGLRVASHEIRQPVAAVLALAEAARLHPEVTPNVRGYLERIIDQAAQIAETARSVLEVENHRQPQRVVVDVDGILDDVLETFRLTWSGTLERHGRPGVPALGDPSLLRRCIINILENATRAAGRQGKVRITVARQQGCVVVQVDDDGPGVGNVVSGSRIGLALTRRALSGMNGSLQLGASPDTTGARARLSVPLLTGASSRVAPTRSTAARE